MQGDEIQLLVTEGDVILGDPGKTSWKIMSVCMFLWVFFKFDALCKIID